MDGTEYESVTVRNILGSIARYLKEKKYVNILEHDAFKDLQEALKRKMKELKDKGMGNGPRTGSLTKEEDETLWESGGFIPATPLGLLNFVLLHVYELWHAQRPRTPGAQVGRRQPGARPQRR